MVWHSCKFTHSIVDNNGFKLECSKMDSKMAETFSCAGGHMGPLETLVAWYEMHFDQFSESMHSDSKTLREALQLFAA